MDKVQEILDLEGPIAVFGGSGFMGANLVREIKKHRSDCFAVTHQRFVPWRLLDIPASNVVRCDIRDASQVEKVFQRFPFKTLFAFAAYGAYARQSDPAKIFETNTAGLLNIVRAAERRGFSALVHAGSSSEYGTHCAGPSESDPLAPNSYYSVSKISASYLLQYLATLGLPVMNLRFYSVYGPLEEWDRLIPQVVESGLKKTLPPLVNPDISRDFVYIDDAITASLLAANKGVKRRSGASVNIGSGKRTTIAELVEIARELFDIPATPQWGSMPNRAWDLKDWYANPELAKTALEWTATTSLREGLKATAEFMRSRGPSPKIRLLPPHDKLERISAVVACYKDAEAIPIMHERLTQTFRKLNVDYEIIFINDASPDNTDEVLQRLCDKDPHVLAIEHSRNFGSQNAFLDGMSIATGDAVVLLDGDLQDPPELIEQFHEKWRGGFDVVYGRRVKREATRLLQICYKLFYRTFQRLAYVHIPLDAGDFSLMDRKVVDQILNLRETDQFLRGLRAWVGFKQTGIDYVRPARPFGTSTNNWAKNFWWARKAIFSFSFAPMEMLLYGGAALTGLSFLGGIAQIIARLADPSIPHGVSTLIILILFFGGVNMLGLAVLGEYLGKIFEETKDRPKFIRRSIRMGKEHITSTESMDAFLVTRLRQLEA